MKYVKVLLGLLLSVYHFPAISKTIFMGKMFNTVIDGDPGIN